MLFLWPLLPPTIPLLLLFTSVITFTIIWIVSLDFHLNINWCLMRRQGYGLRDLLSTVPLVWHKRLPNEPCAHATEARSIRQSGLGFAAVTRCPARLCSCTHEGQVCGLAHTTAVPTGTCGVQGCCGKERKMEGTVLAKRSHTWLIPIVTWSQLSCQRGWATEGRVDFLSSPRFCPPKDPKGHSVDRSCQGQWGKLRCLVLPGWGCVCAPCLGLSSSSAWTPGFLPQEPH
jgi:hypothetical protein